ncbi:MAG TPA: DUF2142 domain-containing protein [Ardenticatenaceae bacterium]|nr:DUF2142 domain-containing protein [Ardenticatenaceae bacterium]
MTSRHHVSRFTFQSPFDRAMGAVVILYLVAAILFALLTPRWQAPDEPAHFNYVQSLAQHGRLPLLAPGCYPAAYLEELKSRRFPPDLPTGDLCYEAHQPPLYYLLAAPVARAAAALGLDPLLAVRLFSVLIGAGVVVASAALVRELFPDDRLLAVGVAGLVATIPMHLTFLSAANNDGLAELFLTLGVWQMLRLLRRPEHRRAWLRLGLVLGLSLLTKTTAYIALPLVVLTALLIAIEARRSSEGEEAHAGPAPPLPRSPTPLPLPSPASPPGPGHLLRSTITTFAVALLFALPWFARNSVAYSGLDILGLERHDEIVVGQPRAAEWVAERGLLRYSKEFALTTFHSFWGQFGWMAAPLPAWIYSLLWFFTAVGAVGSVLFLIRGRRGGSQGEDAVLSRFQRHGLVLLTAWVGCNLAVYFWYNLTFVQFQGRYLFPSLSAIATFLLLGWREWIAPRSWPLALGGMFVAFWLLDLWSLLTIIIPQLSP